MSTVAAPPRVSTTLEWRTREGSGRRASGRLVWGGVIVATVVAGWWTVATRTGGSHALLSAESLRRAGRFVGDLLGRGAAEPAYGDGAKWAEAGRLAVETLGMSVLAAALAAGTALVTLPLAARNRVDPSLAPARGLAGRVLYVATRGAYVVARAVPELFWAMLLVFVVEPGPLAAVLALAVHNFGVLGRVGADQVEDLDPGPIRALRSTGAGHLQVLAYGLVPQLLPQFLTFLLYRWEVIIRTTAVVGFVVSAGLGYRLRLELSLLHYTDVALLLVVYVMLVWAVDLASAGLRRLAG